MACRILPLYIFFFMVFLYSVESSSISDDLLIDDYHLSNVVNTPSALTHPLHFISLICQQPEQYPIRLTRKLCSTYLQQYKLQDEEQQQQQQQQRGKRVGWTISV
jgi:hypothetical protein